MAGGEACIQSAAASAIGIGSDIGGSIRIPAFSNGVFGHKATTGLYVRAMCISVSLLVCFSVTYDMLSAYYMHSCNQEETSSSYLIHDDVVGYLSQLLLRSGGLYVMHIHL